ncbi:MAG: hypothetical protein V4510_08025 [bacterium]
MAPMGLFGGLLDRFTEIVGDGPSYATFHFASQQEGARLGAGAAPPELGDLLHRVDGILGHRSRLVAAGPDEVVVEVDGSPLVGGGHVGQGILLGFIEGLLKAVLKRPFEGAIDRPGALPGRRLLRFHKATP